MLMPNMMKQRGLPLSLVLDFTFKFQLDVTVKARHIYTQHVNNV